MTTMTMISRSATAPTTPAINAMLLPEDVEATHTITHAYISATNGIA